MFMWITDVDEMMGELRSLIWSRFRGTDIELSIYLPRIRRHDLKIGTFQRKKRAGFSRRCRTGDNEDFFHVPSFRLFTFCIKRYIIRYHKRGIRNKYKHLREFV